MDLDKIYKKLKPKDVPMLTFPEMEKLIFFFKRIDDDITLAEVSKRLDMSLERLFEINHKVGLHFRENLAPKVLFKAMINAYSGKIKVESKKGKGTLFTVHLPV